MINKVAVIILAAGMGTRMKSDKAKVLHEITDQPMISYVVETAKKIAGDSVIVVVGHQAQEVQGCLSGFDGLIFAHQDKQLGTGHAVQCALTHIPAPCEEVVILCGDVPLIRSETIFDLVEDHLENTRDISLLAVELDNPFGYGRVVLDENQGGYRDHRRNRRYSRAKGNQADKYRHLLHQKTIPAGGRAENQTEQCPGRIIPHRCHGNWIPGKKENRGSNRNRLSADPGCQHLPGSGIGGGDHEKTAADYSLTF